MISLLSEKLVSMIFIHNIIVFHCMNVPDFLKDKSSVASKSRHRNIISIEHPSRFLARWVLSIVHCRWCRIRENILPRSKLLLQREIKDQAEASVVANAWICQHFSLNPTPILQTPLQELGYRLEVMFALEIVPVGCSKPWTPRDDSQCLGLGLLRMTNDWSPTVLISQ